jgi:hypothetical protein
MSGPTSRRNANGHQPSVSMQGALPVWPPPTDVATMSDSFAAAVRPWSSQSFCTCLAGFARRAWQETRERPVRCVWLTQFNTWKYLRMISTFVRFGTWMFIALTITAPHVVAADDAVDRTLDLRNATDVSGRFFVVLCARKSKDDKEGLGHAFVIWAKEDDKRQLSAEKAFGFYPKEGEGKKAFFGDVKGKLVNEAMQRGGKALFNHPPFDVQVNEKAWNESQRRMNDWKTSEYNLFGRNCTHFVYDVASDLGVFTKKPDAEFPSVFLSRLIEEAKKRED